MEKHLVFVYGTLKRGGRLHDALRYANFLGVHSTDPVYAMYTTNDLYPYICDGNSVVHGEVFEVDDENLRYLDRVEGYPDFYNRKLIETPWGDAWVYYINVKFIKSGSWEA